MTRILIFTGVLALAVTVARLFAIQDAPSDVVIVQRDYDTRALLAAPPLPEPVMKGRTLWLQRCAYCHDGVGTPTYQTMGPWLDAETLRTSGEARVREKIANGSVRMPGFKYGLQPEQVDRLIAFLRTVTPDQAPTADQRNKVSPRFLTSEVAGPATGTPATPLAATASLGGTIRGPGGKPLDGVAVSVKAPDRTITTSVFTDERGEYAFPKLPAGSYRMWAQAVGFATSYADVTLKDAAASSQVFTLSALADFTAQLSGVEWWDALPDDTVEHRRMKQVLHVACSDCHSLAVVLQNRFDESGWRAIVKSMEEGSHTGWGGRLDPTDEQLGFLGGIMRHHREDLVRYLSAMRGPGPSPMKFTPLPRPRGDAARVVVTEYDVPIAERRNELAWYNGSDWSEGPAVGMHGIVGVHDVVTDAAGYAWLAEARVSFETHRTFTRLDVNSGEMRAVAMADREGRLLLTEQITQDPKDNLWFHLAANRLARFTPKTMAIATFTPPRAMGPFMNSNDVDPQGYVWSNGRYGSFRFDPSTSTFRFFQQRTPADGTTYGVAGDADGNGWWSQFLADRVIKADAKTGVAQEISMRDPQWEKRRALMTPADLAYYDAAGSQSWGGYPANPVPFAASPRRLASDKSGRTVWVPNWAGETLARIDIRTLKTTFYPLPIHGHPYSTRVDRHHNVWADVPLGDRIVKLDPRTEQWTVYRLPSAGCGSRHLWVDDARGEVWLPCDQSSRVARFQFRTTQQIDALKTAGASAAVRPAATTITKAN